MIKKIMPLVFVSTVVFPVVGYSEDSYQYEGVINYSSTDEDDFIDIDVIGASVTLFTEPVSYKGKPYKEAGFLARKTNVTFALGTVEFGFDNVDVDTLALGANVQYMLPESALVFGAGFTSADGDETLGTTKVDVDLLEVAVSVGYFPEPLSRIRLIAGNSELEINVSTGERIKLDTDTIAIEYVSLMRLNSGNYAAINGKYKRVDFEDVDIDIAQVGGDYYFTQTTSVGGGLSYLSADAEAADGESVTLRFRHFVDKFTSFGFQVEKFSSKASNSDSDTISFKFLHRY